MISNLNEEIQLTDVNSAHTNSAWNSSWSKSYKADDYFYKFWQGECNSPDIYNRLVFHNDISLLATHVFPDYNEIKKNLPDIKIILINISENDLEEVADNCFTKNNTLFNRNNVMFSINARRVWINREPKVPADLIDRILLIEYNEIYQPIGESFVALEKLKAFTNTDIGSVVFESYKKYVNNRNIKWNQ